MPEPTREPAASSAPTGGATEIARGRSQGSPESDVDAVPVGTLIGRYVVLETLGSGGMGTVLRAYDPKLHREVALKRLRSRNRSRELDRRLVAEAQALAQLSHPNVVAVYDVSNDADRVILTMELVRGPSLDRWLREPRPWRERVQVLLQAGRGLAAAHRANLVHRDFKPANVMIVPEGQAKVTDFGLAKPAATEESSEAGLAREHARAHLPPALALDEPVAVETRADVVLGTPAYMAPEQHAGMPANPAADQYAFCVTLWQALTGERPFGGAVADLMQAKHDGPPRWPKQVPVPSRLVEAVRRGLAPHPGDRWPSMDALLDELSAALGPRRSRRRLGGLTAVIGGALLLVMLLQNHLQQRCGGAAEQLATIWNDEQRAAVRRHIEVVGTDVAEPIWSRISERVDGYAEAWAEGHRAACEATTIRGEQSAAVLDLRMACLSRAREQLRASVEQLAGVDDRTVHRAVEMVEHLPSLERCADVQALLAEAPPPEDPVVRAAVEDARGRLAHAWSLHRLGRYDESLEVVRLVQADAESLDHPPLTAELAALEGLVMEALGRFEHAEWILRRGAWLAIEHGATTVAAETIATWSFVLAERLGRVEEGLVAAELGLRLARRTGEPSLQARALARLAGVVHARGDASGAEALYREALTVLEGAPVLDELELATILNDLGGLLQEQRRGEEALAAHRRALEIRERLLGEGHPYVGSSLTNLGNVLQLLGEPEQAERNYERALAIYARVYGEDHALTTLTRGNLGALLIRRGSLDRAASLLEQVTRARERIYGPDHGETASAYNNLGALEQARGRPERAHQHLRRALASWTKALGPQHPQLRSVHYSLGLLEQDLGRREQAIESFERALALAADAPAEQLGDIQLALATALWDDPAARARARALGEQALSNCRAGGGVRPSCTEAEAWLSSHAPAP